MNGIWFIALFVLSIIAMIVAISRWKVHPFLAIIGISIILAIAGGIPLSNIPTTISKGVSGIFANIGLIIIFGMLTGLILEKTGAALKLADGILKIVGQRHPQIAMLIIGYIISIPVFCDSGFVIINPIRKSLAQKTKISPIALTTSLSGGLYVSHLFLPPTPGPIAAAGLIGIGNSLLNITVLGIIVSIPTLIVAYLFSSYIGKRVKSTEEFSTNHEKYQTVLEKYGKLPSFSASLIPILLPIILMGLGSIVSLNPKESFAHELISFLGKPVIALIAALISALPLLYTSGRMKEFYSISEDAFKTAGPIIFITAAGGVLGQIIVETGFVSFIQDNALTVSSLGVFFPFLIAAILKSAQGSSSVAMITTAGIMGIYSSESSLMYALGLTDPLSAAFTVLSIGAGAMTVSHANDSYFWVVTNFGGIKPQDGYKTQTLITLLMGFTGMATIQILSLILR